MISSTKDGTTTNHQLLRSNSGEDSPTTQQLERGQLYDEELGGEEELLQDTPTATPDTRRHRRKSMRPGGVRTDWLARCANEWCGRSGGEALRASPQERSYEELVASSAISAEDAEQIDMVCIRTLSALLHHPASSQLDALSTPWPRPACTLPALPTPSLRHPCALLGRRALGRG